MGWLSITAGKSRVMSPRLNSSFISPHAQVSSSLSVLIVSIPKFDCRSLSLSQPSYSLIRYSTSKENYTYTVNNFNLTLPFPRHQFGHIAATFSFFTTCITTGSAKLCSSQSEGAVNTSTLLTQQPT